MVGPCIRTRREAVIISLNLDYFSICDLNTCAAILLAQLQGLYETAYVYHDMVKNEVEIYGRNARPESYDLWIFKTDADIQRLVSIFGDDELNQAVWLLEKKGLVAQRQFMGFSGEDAEQLLFRETVVQRALDLLATETRLHSYADPLPIEPAQETVPAESSTLETAPFFPVFVKLAGSLTAAVLLSYVYALTLDQPDAWHAATAIDIQAKTGLSSAEQSVARKRLKLMDILEEKRTGTSSRTFSYRINLPNLRDQMNVALLPPESFTDNTERLLTLYRVALRILSLSGLARATKQKVVCEYVDYSEIVRRDHAVCHICGKAILFGPGLRDQALHFDHVFPISAGGPHIAENIRCSHAACNLRKSDRIPEA